MVLKEKIIKYLFAKRFDITIIAVLIYVLYVYF